MWGEGASGTRALTISPGYGRQLFEAPEGEASMYRLSLRRPLPRQGDNMEKACPPQLSWQGPGQQCSDASGNHARGRDPCSASGCAGIESWACPRGRCCRGGAREVSVPSSCGEHHTMCSFITPRWEDRPCLCKWEPCLTAGLSPLPLP